MTINTATRKSGRRKMVSTGAITSRKLARVSIGAEFVYWRVYLASDNFGTMSGDPWDVWQRSFPGKNGADEPLVASWIDELVAVGLVERWSVDGSVWIHLLGHDLHQQSSWIARRGARQSPIPPSHAKMIAGDGVPAQDPITNSEEKTCVCTEPRYDAGSVRSPAIACVPITITKTIEERREDQKQIPSGLTFAHASQPAHEAARPDDDEIEAPNQLEKIAAETRRCKRELGDLAFDAETAIAEIRTDRGIDLEPTWLIAQVWRPAVLMLAEFGRKPTRQALASIVAKPGVAKPKPWMRAVAESAAAEELKPKKPVESYAERKAREDKETMLASLNMQNRRYGL